MTFGFSKSARIVVAALAIWFVLGVISVVLFHGHGSAPGDGRGERIELPAKR